MESDEWFILGENDQPLGPFTRERILRTHAAGKIPPGTKLSQPGSSRWFDIAEVIGTPAPNVVPPTAALPPTPPRPAPAPSAGADPVKGRRSRAVGLVAAGLLLVAAGLIVGVVVLVGNKKLSPAEARNMLSEKAALGAPMCSLHGGSAKAHQVKTGYQVVFTDKKWGDLARDVGVIDAANCEPKGSETECTADVRMGSAATMECGRHPMVPGFRGFEPDPFTQIDCTFFSRCGRADVVVDSIITDGSKSTIKYTVTPVVDEEVRKAGSKAGYMVRFAIVNQTQEKGTATALRTDDGRWILDK